MWQVREAKDDSRQGQEQALDMAVCTLQGAEMKQTQYERILAALRKAGKKGCTNHDLMLYSNCPWKRIDELYERQWRKNEWCIPGQVTNDEVVQYDYGAVNGRIVRIYRLVKA